MPKPLRGTFTNWHTTKLPFTKEEIEERFPGEDLLPIIVSGNVYDDPSGKWENGQWVRTSFIVNIDYENKIIETKNSIYRMR